ncbi:glycerol-3-phosphate dehydrogenase/oxidase [soil metagenome]
MATSLPSPELRRLHAFTALGAAPFDVLVIGGGITGAGVARDAALRGLKVALVEQDDFASGTSSRSSRLIHGGVRYLEHGQVHLVFESSRERRTLQRIAPHLVRPLAFTWPVYRGARVPRWKLGIGLALYDVLALFRNVGRHRRLDARGVIAREPRLLQAGLAGGAQYWDAAADDVRLTLANVLSAQGAGAVVVNHARVEALLRDGERITGVRVLDVVRGGAVDVRARVTVNATGPWSDRVESLAHAGSVAGVRGSKGVHVSVPRSRMGNVAALTLVAPQDGRVMFVLPAGAFTIIGTTDTFDDVAPEDVRAAETDVSYLLAAANHYFPEAQLARTDVVSAWAGLRPLAAGHGSDGDPGSASREHSIATTMPGLVRVTGGKLTTYRAMAEEIVDVVEQEGGFRRAKSSTAHVPLGGGDLVDLRETIMDATRTIGDAVIAERLVHAHGSAWRGVWAPVATDALLGTRVAPDRPYLLAELHYGVTHELARTLGDLLIRRTPVAFETADHGRTAARSVAGSVGTWLGWSEEETARALAAYDAETARVFTVEA